MSALKPVSPAAAAAISRALAKAGIRKAREIKKGIETSGFVVEPHGQCALVEYVSFADLPRERADGLKRCEDALKGSYEVKRAIHKLGFQGELRDMEVLEVTSDRWER